MDCKYMTGSRHLSVIHAAAVCAQAFTQKICWLLTRFPIENAVVSLGMSFTLPWQLVIQIVVSMVMNRGRVHAYLYQTNSCFYAVCLLNNVYCNMICRLASSFTPKRQRKRKSLKYWVLTLFPMCLS